MSKKYEDTLKILFEKCDIGQLTIRLPTSEELTFSGDIDGPKCDIVIHNWKIMGMLAKRGDIGLGEAYHLGFWDSSDVPNFLTYCSLNLSSIKNKGQASFFNKIFFYLHNQLVRANTLYGSKKNILEHYDIGNDFYQSWLDPTMTYSSAIKTSDKDSLMDAQLHKYQRIISKINVQNKDILEIGCGWGGFAEEAVVTGARVTGLTISNKQYDFAKKRLNGNAEILMRDYRKIKGTFDRIVSIEMFEAVGEKFWKTYFDQVKRLLKKKWAGNDPNYHH
jgi:cyclopropane-fatty-acyl-phospholipid synthase